ncbi:nucleotide pyrophosphohydrolase [Pseudonocardia sp. GCM10023141]|uniref:nucleotide pyrophosphohydrolase n=1 Tax=Pseudonocardia sp. GCM10023141 TaxID=3252653 RepID=UPI00361C7E68
MDDITALTERLRTFTAARDWEQFHTPKNLAIALVAEAGELAAEFQWLTPDQAAAVREPGGLRDRVAGELADVLIYLVRLADVSGLDQLAAAAAKIEVNETRFPPDVVRGRSTMRAD